MADNLNNAIKMNECSKKYPNLVNMLCPPPHRMPWELFIKESFKNNSFGKPISISLISINTSGFDKISFRDKVEYSGQQIMQVGIWAETLNSWLGKYKIGTNSTNGRCG